MKKVFINLLAVLFLLITIVGAANYEYLYNPYSGTQDRSLSLNQTNSALIVTNLTIVDTLNMTSGNITNVDCIIFISGGKICTG